MISDYGFGENFWFDIRKELRRLDTETFSDSDSAIPDEITHYTSLEGLKGIIGRREIWCTDIRQVNDPHEGDYGMAVIQNVITRKPVPSKFADFVMHQKRLFGTKELFTDYIACFCAAHDTDAMWLDYAQEGIGYGIVFDSQALLGAAEGGTFIRSLHSYTTSRYSMGRPRGSLTELSNCNVGFKFRRPPFLGFGSTKFCSLCLSAVPDSKTQAGDTSRKSG